MTISKIIDALRMGVYGKVVNDPAHGLYQLALSEDVSDGIDVISDFCIFPERSVKKLGKFYTTVQHDEIFDAIKINPVANISENEFPISGWSHKLKRFTISTHDPVPSVENLEFRPSGRETYLAFVSYDYNPLEIIHVYEAPFAKREEFNKIRLDSDKINKNRETIYRSSGENSDRENRGNHTITFKKENPKFQAILDANILNVPFVRVSDTKKNDEEFKKYQIYTEEPDMFVHSFDQALFHIIDPSYSKLDSIVREWNHEARLKQQIICPVEQKKPIIDVPLQVLWEVFQQGARIASVEGGYDEDRLRKIFLHAMLEKEEFGNYSS